MLAKNPRSSQTSHDYSRHWQRLFYLRWYQTQLTKIINLWQHLRAITDWRKFRGWLLKRVAMATAVLLLGGNLISSWQSPHPVQAALLLPPVTVNTLADELSGSNNGACSLREAIQLANGDLTERGCGTLVATSISVPSGTITLSLTGVENDGSQQAGAPDNTINDLDIPTGTTITISGQGSGNTIIQAGTTADDGTGSVGNGIDRVFHVEGNLTLNDVTIRNGLVTGNNTGKGVGGGIWVYDSGTATINNSIITGNVAHHTGTAFFDGYGGGINNYNSSVTLNNTDVTNNTATRSGGGIINLGSGAGQTATLNINGGTLSGNVATDGGGIDNFGFSSGAANLDMDGTTISANNAYSLSSIRGMGGGARFVQGGSGTANATITNSTFSGNVASRYGGAISMKEANVTLTITNSTIANNSNTHAGFGIGGLYISENAGATIVNSTISGNTATAGSGGNGVYTAYSGTAVIKNSILTNNQNNDCAGGSISGNDNLVDDGTCAGSLGAVTNFDTTLANNGGNTETHAITIQSNAVDAGNGTDCSTNGITQDQRQTVNRGACDIGAFEIGDLSCGITAAGEPNVHNFFTGVSLTVTDDGSDLDCLVITEFPTNHPNAVIPNLQTGTYWIVEGYQSDLSTLATSDFMLNMTLPHTVSPDSDAQVCRHVSGTTWDCVRTSSTVSTVTRDGISDLSDWTVGDDVDPTAISLQNTSVSIGARLTTAFMALFSGLAGATWFALRRKRKSAS